MMFTGGDFQGGRIHSQGFLDQAEDPGIGHFLDALILLVRCTHSSLMHPLHTLAVKRCYLSSFLLLWKNVKFETVVLTVSKEKFYHQDGEFSQLHFILPWPSIIERQPKD